MTTLHRAAETLVRVIVTGLVILDSARAARREA